MKLKTTIKSRAVSLLRKSIAPILLTTTCAIASASTVTERLVLQHKIDAEVPLAKATFIGTHNSYNASDWDYPFPNQFSQPIEQLNAGLRVINFDIHTHINFTLSGEVTSIQDVLCHISHETSLTCRSSDKSLYTALHLLNNWLENNPEEMVLLVLEDYIKDWRYPTIVNIINNKVGKRVYKTDAQPYTSHCSPLPVSETTKQDVLDAGKQLIIAVGGEQQDCKNVSKWADWVWYLPNVAYKGDAYKTDRIRRFPQELSFLFEDRLFGLIFDDRTMELTGSEITDALNMGAAVVGLDFALGLDRRDSAIWSWDAYEPNNSNNEDCTVQRDNGRWNDVSCSRNYHYACQSANNGRWEISPSLGSWHNGNQACKALGDEFFFSMPVNANENKSLRIKKDATNLTNIWLNHNDIDNEGQWRSVHLYNHKEQYDTLTGTENDDKFTAEQGNQDFYGNGGTDTVTYGHAVNGIDVRLWDNQTYNDGFGTHDNLYSIENIHGSTHNDYISGSAENNYLYGWHGDDTILGGAGNDTLVGESGKDKFYGGTGTDKVSFIGAPAAIDVNLVKSTVYNDGYGNTEEIFEVENILGSNFNDVIKGTDGNNRLEGDDGDDLLQGKKGNDSVYGGTGNDELHGGDGNDSLFGGDNNDWLKGAKGNDKLTGGFGADIFVLSTTDGYDTIEDFNWNAGDKIHIDASAFSINSLEELTVVTIEHIILRAPIYELRIGNHLLAMSKGPISVSRDIVLF